MQSTTDRHHSWRVLKPVLGGMLGLAVAMGIGRFAYTPLLPLMEEEFHFSTSFAGLLASWNYFGYLVGAIAAGWLPNNIQRNFVFRYRIVIVALVGSISTTELMALTSSHVLWCILRGLSGLFSAGALVLSSNLIMDWLTIQHQTQKIGVFYAGVGIGIMLTGILVPVFRQWGGWRLGWQGLGVVSLTLVIGVWYAMRHIRDLSDPVQRPTTTSRTIAKARPFHLWGITLAYGMEGLGYIVTATFITVFFRHDSNAPWLGDVSWILVGLAAAPSTWFWTKAAYVYGWRSSAYAAYICQAVGVMLPVIWPGVLTALIGSVLFGGTFMGITTLSLAMGRQYDPDKAGRVIGNMTGMFSVGQVVGPIVAGDVTAATLSYTSAMLVSSLVLFAAAVLLWLSRNKNYHRDGFGRDSNS